MMGLQVHSELGPWIAYRAIIVFEGWEIDGAPFAALQSKIETFARSPNAPPVMLFSMIVILKLLKPRLMADEYSAGLGGEDEPVVDVDDADSESPADEADGEEAAVDDGDDGGDEAGVEVTFVNVTPIAAEDAEGAD